MNNMMLYLTTQTQIKEMVVVLGVESSEYLIKDICDNMMLERMFIFVPTKKLQEKIENVFLEGEYVSSFHRPVELQYVSRDSLKSCVLSGVGSALIFDGVQESGEITRLKSINAQILIGNCDRNKVNPFLIWEEFRQTVEDIYIVSWGDGEKILSWKKRMDSDIELSIIFPMYNIEKYLRQCIDSVCEWKAEYIEFLFVDDGSPDHCGEIVQEYAKRDHRIKLLSKKNGGCASARQYGLDQAKGRYIGFIDPDDYIDPSMFRKLLSNALVGNYEISYCGYNEYYEDTKTSCEVSDMLGEPYCNGTSDPVKINELISYLRVGIWRGIYSKELIERGKIHFYTELKRFDDLPFKVETLSKAHSVIALPEYLYFYRMSRPGQDVSADDERLYVHFDIFKHLDEYIGQSSDRRQIDYLQLVKVHTHAYALKKIRKEFFKKYCKMAQQDIRAGMNRSTGRYVVGKLGGERDKLLYLSLYHGWFAIVYLLCKNKKKKRNKYDKVLMKLEKL